MFVSSSGASILHADLDAFFASVEQRDDPRLRQRPVIVGLGVVLAASYEAKAFGVRTAMGAAAARRLCPHAIVVPPRMSAYSEASKAVFRIFEDASPVVEGMSIDEAFLDVHGMERSVGSPTQIAVRLRQDVRERVGPPITVGVARTKFLAKVANGVAKPDGLLVVPPQGELAFLHPLEVERLWGVGPVTARKLRGGHHDGWTTRTPARGGADSDARACDGTPSPLSRSQPRPPPGQGRRRRGSIGSQHARGRSPWSHESVDAAVVALVDRVTRRLRAARRVGRTVVLRLRFGDFTRATGSHTLPQATSSTTEILAVARGLLAASLPDLERRGVTLVGISVANLEDANAVQLVLPLERVDSQALDAALDEVRDRFGSAAITRGVLLGRNPGITMPLLPD